MEIKFYDIGEFDDALLFAAVIVSNIRANGFSVSIKKGTHGKCPAGTEKKMKPY